MSHNMVVNGELADVLSSFIGCKPKAEMENILNNLEPDKPCPAYGDSLQVLFVGVLLATMVKQGLRKLAEEDFKVPVSVEGQLPSRTKKLQAEYVDTLADGTKEKRRVTLILDYDAD